MSKPQSGGVAVILLLLILVSVVGLGGYYIGTQNSSSKTQPSPASQTQALSPSPVSSPSTSPTASLPSGWTYQTNLSCSVQIPIPPKAEPYTTTRFTETPATSDNNRYWRFLENTESEMLIFKDDASAVFYPVEFDGLGNGYNPGSVNVFCAPNPNNLTAEQIIAAINQDIKTKQWDFKIINTSSENKWGIDTKVINIEGGMFGDTSYYVFPANGKMYFVSSSSGSSNQPVKDTTKQIFDNLKFSN